MVISGAQLHLAPAPLALPAVLARRHLKGDSALGAPAKDVPDLDWAQRYLTELRKIAGQLGDIDPAEQALRQGMDGNYFSTTLSRLREILKRQVGSVVTQRLIDDGACLPRRYSLALPLLLRCCGHLLCGKRWAAAALRPPAPARHAE